MTQARMGRMVVLVVGMALVAGCGGSGTPTGGVEPAATGAKIVFASEAPGDWHIFTMGPYGANRADLTPGNTYANTMPCWSPDHRKIAFVSTRKGAAELFVMDANGLNLRRLTFGATATDYVRNPAWSPDGKKIAFQREHVDSYTHLYVINPEGGGQRQVTSGGHHDQNPTWLPDGSALLFDSDRKVIKQLFKVDPTGLNLMRFRTSAANDRMPVCAPDVARILFASDRLGGRYNQWSMKLDGTDLKRITNVATGAFALYGSWGPGGTAAVFTRMSPGVSEVRKINADGSGSTPLTDAAGEQANWADGGRVPS